MNDSETAILVMDYQQLLVSSFVSGADECLTNVSRFLGVARSEQIPVIFVTVGFRPGFPEVSDRNKIFSSVRDGGRFLSSDTATQIPALLGPGDTDLVVNKCRVSAFEGTDLQVILRARGISHLVMFGIITSGVVLSTVRQAADLDYKISVIKDFCHDPDANVQEVLLEKVLPMQAEVVTSAQYLKKASE